jgi:FkbM family methyltransferase
MRTLAWRAWERLPESVRSLLRPALAAVRRSRRVHTPLPAGPRPELPADAVELDTAIGTLWFDGADTRLTPWARSQGVWEADVMKLLAATLRPGGVFVDVGANVGFHTVLAAQLVGPAGKVFAVEPAPWTLQLLRANVWRSAAAVTVLPFAASDATGTVRLAHEAGHRSGARLSADGGIEVEAAPLDDLLPEVAADVVKVDVEGAEPLVLRGATGLVARSPHLVVVVEFRDETHLSGETPAEVLAFYESLGFELRLLRRNGEHERASAESVLERSRREPSFNLVLRLRRTAARTRRRRPSPRESAR